MQRCFAGNMLTDFCSLFSESTGYGCSSSPTRVCLYRWAGFSLAKTRRRRRNTSSHRGIIAVPGQRGGNITTSLHLNTHAVLHRHADLGTYNTAHILTFLDRLHNALIPPECMNDADHQKSGTLQCEYVAFLNPIEEVFTVRRRKVVDRQPSVHMPLLQAMEEACEETDVGAIQGWIRHSRCFVPRCLARENVACDVDKALLYPAVQQDAASLFCLPLCLYIFYWHTLSAIFLFSLLFFGSILLFTPMQTYLLRKFCTDVFGKNKKNE